MLLALLQVAGNQWKQLLHVDLGDFQRVLKPTLDQLPPPREDSSHCMALVAQYLCAVETVKSSAQAQYQMGIRAIELN